MDDSYDSVRNVLLRVAEQNGGRIMYRPAGGQRVELTNQPKVEPKVQPVVTPTPVTECDFEDVDNVKRRNYIGTVVQRVKLLDGHDRTLWNYHVAASSVMWEQFKTGQEYRVDVNPWDFVRFANVVRCRQKVSPDTPWAIAVGLHPNHLLEPEVKKEEIELDDLNPKTSQESEFRLEVVTDSNVLVPKQVVECLDTPVSNSENEAVLNLVREDVQLIQGTETLLPAVGVHEVAQVLDLFNEPRLLGKDRAIPFDIAKSVENQDPGDSLREIFDQSDGILPTGTVQTSSTDTILWFEGSVYEPQRYKDEFFELELRLQVWRRAREKLVKEFKPTIDKLWYTEAFDIDICRTTMKSYCEVELKAIDIFRLHQPWEFFAAQSLYYPPPIIDRTVIMLIGTGIPEQILNWLDRRKFLILKIPKDSFDIRLQISANIQNRGVYIVSDDLKVLEGYYWLIPNPLGVFLSTTFIMRLFGMRFRWKHKTDRAPWRKWVEYKEVPVLWDDLFWRFYKQNWLTSMGSLRSKGILVAA